MNTEYEKEKLKTQYGLTYDECEKLLEQTDWDTTKAQETVEFFMASLAGTVIDSQKKC